MYTHTCPNDLNILTGISRDGKLKTDYFRPVTQRLFGDPIMYYSKCYPAVYTEYVHTPTKATECYNIGDNENNTIIFVFKKSLSELPHITCRYCSYGRDIVNTNYTERTEYLFDEISLDYIHEILYLPQSDHVLKVFQQIVDLKIWSQSHANAATFRIFEDRKRYHPLTYVDICKMFPGIRVREIDRDHIISPE